MYFELKQNTCKIQSQYIAVHVLWSHPGSKYKCNLNTLKYIKIQNKIHVFHTCTAIHCNTYTIQSKYTRIRVSSADVSNTRQMHVKYVRNTEYRAYSASCLASLLVKGQHKLLLLVTRVRVTLRKSLESFWDTLVVAVARRLRLGLADRAQVVPYVVLLAHVVASEDVRADAVGLEPLARNAREARRVALALRATPVDELLVRHLDNQVHGENGVHPELDIRHHASVALACHCALKDLRLHRGPVGNPGGL